MDATKLLIPADRPAIVRIQNFKDAVGELKASLTYRDKAAHFEYMRYKNSSWAKQSNSYEETLASKKSAIQKSVLFEDEQGLYTYAGLASYLSAKFRVPVINEVQYPEPELLAWESPPPYKPHYYQEDALLKLLEARHASVSLGTGLGKSLVIQLLVKRLGLPTVVMTPATAISEQLYNGFVKLFGKKKVGRFFDGKKESGKLITVANAQSLTRLAEGDEHYENLKKTKVFIADESHQCPANTLESVCLGLMGSVPYRFFFSATQIRGDGREVVLEGIIGPVVYSKTVKEGVDEGFLAKPVFRLASVTSTNPALSPDAGEMTRIHFYQNPQVYDVVAGAVNAAATSGMPVVVLIDEIEQFVFLLPRLRHACEFAHGTLTEVHKRIVPEKYWVSDNSKLVAKFNAGEIPVLVGTSCINTGVDIQAVKFLVNLQGGKSEVTVKQSVGRATRLCPGKNSCIVMDVKVSNIELLVKHFEARKAIYAELYPDVKEVE